VFDVEELNKLYAPCCEHEHLHNLSASDDDIAKELADMVQAVYNETGLPKDGIFKKLVEYFANKLWNGTTTGFGEDLINVDFNTPDYNMLAALQKNVWQFSSAKNYQQLVQLSKALVDDDGKLRTFSDFKDAAKEVNDKFINQWLQAEYNLAVAGGQMAGKWVDIEANKDVLPLLEFDAVIDEQTTELCASLNGTVRPVDDAFWNTYYPPNHFNCRSTVRQVAGGTVTPVTKISYPEIPNDV
jgi:SPP1 gp7 family putative phage head morphogenesis protein